MTNKVHIPVLPEETLNILSPKQGESYLDLTAGYGGHANRVIKLVGREAKVTLVDRDISSIDYLKKNLAVDNVIEFINSDFEQASKVLQAEGRQYDIILADLGISSPHLDNPDRGFSFMYRGPLDMRMDNRCELSAEKVVNTYDEISLADVLYKYGELKNSRNIASRIVQNRPIMYTDELAKVIPVSHKNKMRVLAQVFQALRIEVNDELGQLQRSLPIWQNLLTSGGRLAVITFHSLEDRIVKDYFSDFSKDDMLAEFKTLNKKPITAQPDEVVHNPRARSAKLRALQRK